MSPAGCPGQGAKARLARGACTPTLQGFFQIRALSGLFDGHWTPNLLRHTAASLMADAGMPIEQVADQLGHRDLRMLQKHYRHRIKPTIGGAHILNNVLHDTDQPADP